MLPVNPRLASALFSTVYFDIVLFIFKIIGTYSSKTLTTVLFLGIPVCLFLGFEIFGKNYETSDFNDDTLFGTLLAVFGIIFIMLCISMNPVFQS